MELLRYKSRLVARGYAQIERMDYIGVYYLVVKLTMIQVLLTLVVQLDMKLEQLDVKVSFLYRD